MSRHGNLLAEITKMAKTCFNPISYGGPCGVTYVLTSALCSDDFKCIEMYRKMTFDVRK